MYGKTALIALLAIGLGTAAVGADVTQTDTAPQFAALTPDDKAPLLPQGKLEKIAAISVPEIKPQVTVRVLPAYPELAQKARIQGTVFARVLVDEEGRVERVAQVKGHAVFREAVTKAADQWQFAPAKQGDRPVKAWVNVPFSFEL